MRIIPGLTSTKKERIPAFIEDLAREGISEIALFPTCLDKAERTALYGELEMLPGLCIPHVHARSDFDEGELDYLCERFGTEVFNIHPGTSTHPFGTIPARHAKRIFVENVEQVPGEVELELMGGLCPDFSHWANAVHFGRVEYDAAMRRLAARYTIGCCHLSALRPDVPNPWHGEWDHHEFISLADLDYLKDYSAFMPRKWASLELENPLSQQLRARRHLEALLHPMTSNVTR
ncbi:MAG: hypothetical protein RBT68_02295 [Spirochaetia bacterium]|jgi:hypothetical protein|nr:hypothetical protein [Spirochaetia bacterium]